eukprot:4514958-Pyramimonas_sp.AAC.2
MKGFLGGAAQVLGSDGLYDHLSSGEVCTFIQEHVKAGKPRETVAEALCQAVRQSHGGSEHTITSFYGSSCANNGKDALNTPGRSEHILDVGANRRDWDSVDPDGEQSRSTPASQAGPLWIR